MPLKQLVPLTKEVDIGDVSSLNEVEGRRILKAVLSEVNARSKAAMNIDKSAEGQKSAAVENEEARQSKALINLKTNLASRVQRSANPRWWHKWL